MQSTLLIALFATLFLSTYAHRPERPNSPFAINRMKRASISPSTCSLMQCAVADGNCGASGSSLTFCSLGQHCDGSKCIADLPIGSTCSLEAFENECAQGKCVVPGDGLSPVCQIFHSVLPGGNCTEDSQCWFSNNADGSGSGDSQCVNGLCKGNNAGDACVANHQCVAGTFCASSTMQCTTLGSLNADCSDDSECSDRFTCLNGKCNSFYTQSKGQSCSTTDNCAPGLYCNSGSCTTALNADRTTTTCDIQSNNCGSDMQCGCANFTSATTATCAPIPGTYTDMPSIQQSAWSCLDTHACGSDISSSETVACIQNNCMSEYCTYFTRSANELFTEYPSCLVARMVGSTDFAALLTKCGDFVPTRAAPSTGSASSLALSFTLLASVSVAAVLAF